MLKLSNLLKKKKIRSKLKNNLLPHYSFKINWGQLSKPRTNFKRDVIYIQRGVQSLYNPKMHVYFNKFCFIDVKLNIKQNNFQ